MRTLSYPPVAHTIRAGWARPVVAGGCGQLAVLLLLAVVVDLGVVGWLAGAGYAAAGVALLSYARRQPEAPGWSAADTVTLIRATLVGGVVALVAHSLVAPSAPVAVLVTVAAIAMVLDAVDGPVARRSGTATPFGARFDMETDALLVLTLSVVAAAALGWWVLVLGIPRYAFGLAARWWPWLRQPLPVRRSRKAVAVAQAVALLVASSGVLPASLLVLILIATIGLLAWSFGRDIGWLWRQQASQLTAADGAVGADGADGASLASEASGAGRLRVPAGIVTAAATALVLAALLLPYQLSQFTAGSLLRISAEGLLAAGLVLALPPRARRVAAAVAGVLLGLIAVVKLIDIGFYSVMARPFDLVLDWSLLAAGYGFVTEAAGRAGAVAIVVGAVLLAIVLVVLMGLAGMRLAGPLARHRRPAATAVAALGAGWVMFALLGTQVVPGLPVADHHFDRLVQVGQSLQDRQVFLAELAVDGYADRPGDQLLAGLRGKDVVIVYVESYGRDAVEDGPLGVGDLLADGDRRLAAAGFESRSGFLTAPVVGGGSWHTHGTLRSGLWVNNPLRYRLLVEGDRFTLNHAFQRAGWDTVAIMPGIFEEWPEGESFGFDRIHDHAALDYQGRRMNWGIIPDQYTISVFEQRERSRPDGPPVMAEIPLLSSHGPWFPIPTLIDWDEVGDGSVFDIVPHASPEELWRDPADGRVEYRKAIEYSVATLISYVETYGDDDLVFIFLGDHQPSPMITGEGASHDVPISLVTRDQEVLDRIAAWGWHEGLRPGPDAPVWRMDAFRDEFLATFS